MQQFVTLTKEGLGSQCDYKPLPREAPLQNALRKVEVCAAVQAHWFTIHRIRSEKLQTLAVLHKQFSAELPVLWLQWTGLRF